MIYTNEINNHKLGHTTPFADVAKSLGWTISFEENEVERSDVDNAYYEKGYVPKFSNSEKVERLKQEKFFEAEQVLNEKLNALSPYPQAESASFDVQLKEAYAYLANPDIAKCEIPVIANIAAGAQIELNELAIKIANNASSFAPLRGLYLGRHKRVRDLLNKAATLTEVEKVDVKAIFEGEIVQDAQ